MIRSLRKIAMLFVATLGLVLASTAAQADPPYRVARLAYATGNVSFSPAGESDWSNVVVNRPLINGDRLWVDASARAELQMGGTSIRAGDQTSLSILNVDDRIAQLQLTQGAIEIRIWRMDPNQVVEIDTPNLAFVIKQAGSYRVDVDTQDGSTGATVRVGAATLYGEGRAFRIGPSDTWRFYDTQLADYDTYRPGQPDALQRFAADRDSRWERSPSARYVSREMIGFTDLDDNGTWRQVRDYGWVWQPTRVANDWAPYRDGHWSWVEPWGWTWVDDAPWGFAPSHYGRWAFVDQRWCWVPGPANVRPVYAPALVAFVGGSGLSVTVSGGGGVVGWFPLAPREVYRPAYTASREYFTRVNTSNTVVNVTQVVNVYNTRQVTNVYVNQRVPNAVIAVPTQAFVQARPVAREIVRVRAENVRPQSIVIAAPVAPARQSVMGAQAASHRPPEQVLRRQVVAQSTPPAPVAPIESRLQQLQQHPGQPVAPASSPARQQAPSGAAPAAEVKVVKPAQPAASPPPPPAPSAKRQEREQRREQRTGQQPVGAPASAAAPAPGRAAASATPPTPPQAPAPATAPSPAASQANERGRDRPSLTRPNAPASASAPAAAPAPNAAPAPAPASAAQPTPATQREQRREQREERRDERKPPAPAAAPTPTPAAPQPAPQPAPHAAPVPPQAAPTPPAATAPAARPSEATPAQQRQQLQQQRQEQRQEQQQQQRQQREEQRREPAPAAPHAAPPAPPAPSAPQTPAAAAPAPQQPARPTPAQRAEERRERASEARQERQERRQ